MIPEHLEASWREALSSEFDLAYFKSLSSFIVDEYATYTCYPKTELLFAALNACPVQEVKVVILGQDPYHGVGQANGLSFSVNEGVPIPPSLRNIFKELASDLDTGSPLSGDLKPWALQGVLLLNAILSVRAGEAGSHQKKGWEEFTNAIIQHINKECAHVVFILWGAYAQKKAARIDESKHLVIRSAHPSPLSSYRGFFGSKPFSQANEFLFSKGLEIINW